MKKITKMVMITFLSLVGSIFAFNESNLKANLEDRFDYRNDFETIRSMADIDMSTWMYNANDVTVTYNQSLSSYNNENDIFMTLSLNSDPRYTATVNIAKGSGDNDLLNRAIVVGDGFDPFNERDFNTIKVKRRYANLIRNNNTRKKVVFHDILCADPNEEGDNGDEIYFNITVDDGDSLVKKDLHVKFGDVLDLNFSTYFENSISIRIVEIDDVENEVEDNTNEDLGTQYINISDPYILNATKEYSRDDSNILWDDHTKYILSYSIVEEYDNSFLSPREMGYDIVFMNFSQGGGDIRKNAMLFTRLLQEIESMTDSSYIVSGISMSGLISKMALLFSKKSNNVHNKELLNNVKGYFTVDTPHQGASTGMLKKVLWQLIDHSNFADWANGEVLLTAENDKTYKQAYELVLDNYVKMSVPAAIQMLYGEHFYEGTWNSFSVAQQNFYQMINSMGGLRKDIPTVAIAQSNFFNPNANLVKTAQERVYRFTVPSHPLTTENDIHESVYAGGPVGSAEYMDLMPGSTGDWYYTLYDWGGGFADSQNTDSYTGTEVYKGTFIPINSALDIPMEVVLDPSVSKDEFNLSKISKFDKVIYLQNEFNNYCNDYSVNGKRFDHIVFDGAVMQKISEAIHYIEEHQKLKVTVVSMLSMLLLQSKPEDKILQWEAGMIYSKGQKVTYNGTVYEVISNNNNGYESFAPNYYELHAVWKPYNSGYLKNWEQNVLYAQGDIVIYNDKKFELIHSTNAGWANLAPDNSSLYAVWRYLPEGVEDWESGLSYSLGAQVMYDGKVYTCIAEPTAGWATIPPNDPSMYAVWELQ